MYLVCFSEQLHLKIKLISFVLRKIFSKVTTLEGLILTLVYPWYTNTEYSEKKDNINS